MNKHNPPSKVKKIAGFVTKHPVIALVLLMLMVVGLIKLIDYSAARYACHTRWVDSTIESKYTLRGGCLVKHKDSWIPERNFRIN